VLKNLQKRLTKLLRPKGRVTIQIGITVLVLVGMLLLAIHFINIPTFKLNKKEAFEGQKELLLLHMDGCPHCVSLMPHWDSAQSDNTSGVKMRKLERQDPGAPDLIRKHKVKGFPTILLLGDGKKLDTYNGPRTKNGILSYLSK